MDSTTLYNGCEAVFFNLLNRKITNFDMEGFWNEFDLKKPPLLTIRIKGAQFTEGLQSTFTKFLQQQHDGVHEEFTQTAALLSRLMARRKNSFRKLMVFKSICKLNSALCRLLRVDLARIMENFSSTLPDVVIEATKVDVPSRNNFDYVLVRLLSVYKIHQRIIECCKDAAVFIAKMLRTNFFIDINTLLLAVIAKIRSNSNILCNNYVKLYGKLLPYRMRFPQNVNYSFLPNDFEFPQELNELSTVKPITEDVKNVDSQSTIISKKCSTPVVTKLKKKCDVGTVVSRKISSNIQPALNIEELQTVDAIRKFIASENEARAKSSRNCRTKAILSHEWQGAVRLFKKKLQANEKKKAVSIFKKFLSSKI